MDRAEARNRCANGGWRPRDRRQQTKKKKKAARSTTDGQGSRGGSPRKNNSRPAIANRFQGRHCGGPPTSGIQPAAAPWNADTSPARSPPATGSAAARQKRRFKKRALNGGVPPRSFPLGAMPCIFGRIKKKVAGSCRIVGHFETKGGWGAMTALTIGGKRFAIDKPDPPGLL